MNNSRKKGSKTATFETEKPLENTTYEDLKAKNRNWSAYIYQLLLSEDFTISDILVDLLSVEIGVDRTSKILDLSLLLLERNNPELFDNYKSREGIIYTEQ